MGTYLSTPVLDKHQEDGESLDCPSTPVAWGVVDMQGWRKSMEDAHIAQADLNVPTHHFDKEVSDEVDGKVFGVFDGHGGPEVARFCQLYLLDVLTKTPTWQEEHHAEEAATNPGQTDIGRALISAFHKLDRHIDSCKYLDELMELRYNKPDTRERRTLKDPDDENDAKTSDTQRTDPVAAKQASKEETDSETEALSTSNSTETGISAAETSESSTAPHSKDDDMKEDDTKVEDAKVDSKEDQGGSTANSDAELGEDDQKDDDSTKVVGKEEASAQDQTIEDESADESEDAAGLAPSNGGKVGSLFKKFLNMNGAEGTDNRKLSTSQPSVMQNGRLVCNLPEHPIHAGATAVVAVIIGRVLTVANAGDSRGVLCQKDGKTHALSFDHKPQDSREMDRIQKAGGFVNQFGRVNGNLNLSRSIGDMKYKQNHSIPPSEQMITAEPDITQITLDAEDEFIILGCDGIWDCLSNEQAVEYVRSRIDKKYPAQIGVEMLDEIISHDPRVTQGIGGDNMTVMIIDLQPKRRPYRNGVEPEPTVESPRSIGTEPMQVDDGEYDA